MVQEILGTTEVKYTTYPDPENLEKKEIITINFARPWRFVHQKETDKNQQISTK